MPETAEGYMEILNSTANIPSEWNRGVFYNGDGAGETAFELVNENDLPRYTTIYNGPDLITDEKSLHNEDKINTDNQFGARFDVGVPGTHGFTVAAKAGGDGGKVLSNADDKAEAKEQDKTKSVEAGADLKLADVGITANISGKRAHDIIKKTENNLKNARVIEYNVFIEQFSGGDATILLSEGLSKWITTIKSNQKIVIRTNLRPMYELLDSERKQSVIDIYGRQEHRYHIPYGAVLNMRHINYGRYMYVDKESRINDNSHGDKVYRGKVLFAFKDFESHRNPLKVRFQQVVHPFQSSESYVKYGHDVILEVVGKETSGSIRVTSTPLGHPWLPGWLLERVWYKRQYVVSSLRQHEKSECIFMRQWTILPAAGYDRKEDDFVRADDGVVFKSRIIGDPKHGPGVFLGLAYAGIKTDKVQSKHPEPIGRYVSGIRYRYPSTEDSELSWRLIIIEE
ncbi:hypothetical protein DFQ28_004465 [Apophysomyces sp. BC1034]|nr:hypothetical protein DFQ28_004465 [Apophysomyces sp. BC1034]